MSPLLPLLVAALAASPAPDAAREVRVLMGTTAEVEVQGLADPGAGLDSAFAALQLVDDSMSLFKPSELTRLNEERRIAASPDLLRVLRCALEIARASSGAFDVTLGTGRGLDEPLRLDAATGTIALAGGVRVDLGGIAKGYAVDLALQRLRDLGARSAIVDLGQSSIGAFGASVAVAIRDPERADAPPWGRFLLDGRALSTSGGDQRPGHILDPRDGRPAQGVLAAAVLASSAMEADALSTAVVVLGADAGLALLESRAAAGYVLQRVDGRAVIRTTRGFADAHGLVLAPGVIHRD